MDIACGFRQPSVFHGCEGMSCKTLNRYDLHLQFKCRGFGCNFLGDSRIVLKPHLSKKIKRSIVSSGYSNSSTVALGDFDSQLWRSNLRRSLFCNLDNVFKGSRTVRSWCQGNDSLAYVNGNGRNVEFIESSDESQGVDGSELNDSREEEGRGEEVDVLSLDELRELLQKTIRELEAARLNSTMFEEKAQKISEAAIALQDEAASAWNDVNSTLDTVQEIVNEECIAKEAVQNATMALSLAEARLQVEVESLDAAKRGNDSLEGSRESDEENNIDEEKKALLVAQEEMKECQKNLANCEVQLRRLQSKKEEFQMEVDRLNEVAEKAQLNALKAEEDVANIMLLAEQAVAFELEATQRVSDAEIALQRADKSLSGSYLDSQEIIQGQVLSDEVIVEEENVVQGVYEVSVERDSDVPLDGESLVVKPLPDSPSQQSSEDLSQYDDLSDHENGKLSLDSPKEAELEAEKSKTAVQMKKLDTQKETSPSNVPKALLKKSSRFFSASFFSFTVDGTEFTPASVFQGFMESVRKQWPKLIVSLLLFGAGVTFFANRAERNAQLLQPPDVITTSIEAGIEEVSSSAKPLVNEEEASLFDMLWLLLASVIFVPIFQKIPGGSPVLGYLAAGILIGPYGLSIIRHVHGTKAIAEFGVVFLLFNIGLELSVERLSSMKKYVFGLGSAQVLVTAVVIGLVVHFVCGQPGPAAIVVGNGLALSSTAVVLQVLQERGESTSRHGRATFSVLLFQVALQF
nr:k(+) efflux antiporter 2, chloroplastic [Quercus suber]